MTLQTTWYDDIVDFEPREDEVDGSDDDEYDDDDQLD
jgi:hypothetical protein